MSVSEWYRYGSNHSGILNWNERVGGIELNGQVFVLRFTVRMHPGIRASTISCCSVGSATVSTSGFNTACTASGLAGVTPHTLRHTFASRLMENGVDPIMATKLAGWSSIKMLDQYAHADPSRMAEAVEGLSRRDIHSAFERRVLRPS